MDLTAIIIVVFCLLGFFGGVAWLEIHSRKKRAPARQGGGRETMNQGRGI